MTKQLRRGTIRHDYKPVSSIIQRKVHEDIEPAMVIIFLIIIGIAFTILAIQKIDIARQEQELLIEQGLLKTGPYWQEDLK